MGRTPGFENVCQIWTWVTWPLAVGHINDSPRSLGLVTRPYNINMAPISCSLCRDAKAILKRPKTGQQICKNCFFFVFETEVHHTITESELFKPGDRVAIGASGGKGKTTIQPDTMSYCYGRFDRPRVCHEDFERAVQLWPRFISLVYRRRDHRL